MILATSWLRSAEPITGSRALSSISGGITTKEDTSFFKSSRLLGDALARISILVVVADAHDERDDHWVTLSLTVDVVGHGVLERGFDLVIGDRFTGSIEEGAMPLFHVWGGKFLSAIGRMRFHTDINDFHCGMRGMTRDAADRLMLKTEGMEFATEMIALASKHELKMGQVPVSLKNSLFPRRSKLRTIRDGFRHLGYMIKKC